MSKKIRIFIKFLVTAIIFYIICRQFTYGLYQEPFHTDENFYLYSSTYYEEIFNHQPANPLMMSHFLALTPPVGLYLIGLSNTLAGNVNRQVLDQVDVTINSPISDSFVWKNNGQTLPPAYDLFMPARTNAAIFGIATCLIFYLFIADTLSVNAGILAALFLAFNTDMLFMSRKALTGSHILFFMFLSTYFLYKTATSQKSKPYVTVCMAMISGICAGLAAATKLNGLTSWIVIVIMLFTQSIFQILSKNYQKLSVTIVGGIMALFFALITFIGVNPYLYANPVTKLEHMMVIRNQIIKWQQDDIGPALKSIPERFTFVTIGTVIPTWNAVKSDPVKYPIFAVPVVLGLILIIIKIYYQLRKKLALTPEIIFIIWGVMTWLSIALWIPLAWEGYRLEAILPGLALAAYAFDRLYQITSAILHHKSINIT
jgi:4-amino-4-deoxy-L-arabinose transferase-like glycosyltransferase